VQMDEVTQQNAALVEQAAAAAASLEEQTRQLQAVVNGWKVAGGQTRSTVAAARPQAGARPNGSERDGKRDSKGGSQHVQHAKTAPQAAAHTPANTVSHAAPASATHGADPARIEPALKPKTARAASESAARPAAASAPTSGSDADWETF
jgi:methyl-accepting chemotaxis protein-1 (serine sensor receptor)